MAEYLHLEKLITQHKNTGIISEIIRNHNKGVDDAIKEVQEFEEEKARQQMISEELDLSRYKNDYEYIIKSIEEKREYISKSREPAHYKLNINNLLKDGLIAKSRIIEISRIQEQIRKGKRAVTFSNEYSILKQRYIKNTKIRIPINAERLFGNLVNIYPTSLKMKRILSIFKASKPLHSPAEEVMFPKGLILKIK